MDPRKIEALNLLLSLNDNEAQQATPQRKVQLLKSQITKAEASKILLKELPETAQMLPYTDPKPTYVFFEFFLIVIMIFFHQFLNKKTLIF